MRKRPGAHSKRAFKAIPPRERSHLLCAFFRALSSRRIGRAYRRLLLFVIVISL
jgi:hypothetical protein